MDTFPKENNPENSKLDNSDKSSDINSPSADLNSTGSNDDYENTFTESKKLLHFPRKKSWRYLFEFLMLFLAVFCGFLAENFRVQLSENKREKEFIHSILEDIKTDTLESSLTIKQLKGLKTGIDSVLILLASPDVFENSNDAYFLWSKNLGLEVFVSNDRTIQQLKNSGDLRLIRSSVVSDGIMKYDQILKKYYAQSNLMYGALHDVTDYSQLFDFISLERNPYVPVPLTDQGKKSLNEAYANLELWRRGLIGLISWLEVVNQEGEDLITLIHKEYQIE